MTKALRSFPKDERSKVANRRIDANTGGLGYCAAVDFKALQQKGKLEKEIEVIEVVEVTTNLE